MQSNEKILYGAGILGIAYVIYRSIYYDENKQALYNQVANQYSKEISFASGYYNIPSKWIIAVICTESSGNPNATGNTDDVGLMQITPQGWKLFQSKFAQNYSLGLETDSSGIVGWLASLIGVGQNQLFDPAVNIAVGTGIMRIYTDQFGDLQSAIQAYNTGQVGTQNGLAYLERVKEFERQSFL